MVPIRWDMDIAGGLSGQAGMDERRDEPALFSTFRLMSSALPFSPFMGIPKVFDKGRSAADGKLRVADREAFIAIGLAMPRAVRVAQLGDAAGDVAEAAEDALHRIAGG